MSFLVPLALGVAIALPTVVLVAHLFRGNRQRVRVPAVFLWRDLPPGLSGRDRKRRPPLTLLLLLQLVAAALVGLALARPATSAGPPPRNVALVLDASASMSAADVQGAESRYDAARAAALRRLDGLRSADTVSVVWAGPKTSLLASGTPTDVRSALTASQPGSGRSDLRAAIALASQQITTKRDRPGSIYVFTDGAFAPLDTLGTLAAPVEFVPVAPQRSGSNNQGITNIQVRPEPSGRGSQEAFIQVTNYDSGSVSLPVSIKDDRGQEIDRPNVDLAPRGTANIVISLSPDVTRLSAQLVPQVHDALALDDLVEVAVPAIGVKPRTISLVSSSPSALQRALEAIPLAKVNVVSPASFDATSPTADLTVLDAAVPAHLPGGPLLIVNPPPQNPLFSPVPAANSPSASTLIDLSNPLLDGVDPAALRFSSATTLQSPAWARAIVETRQGPMILDGFRDGRPIVVFGFDPELSGFDKSIAFPVLVTNAVSHLVAGGLGPAVSPGDSVFLPIPSGGRAVLVRPDGRRETLTPSGNELRIADTSQIGRYTVLDPADDRTVLRSFAVNLLNSNESDIRPRRDLSPIQATGPSLDAEGVGTSLMSEWWRLVAAGAVALLGIEWLMFARRS
jgi:hypothetical protein